MLSGRSGATVCPTLQTTSSTECHAQTPNGKRTIQRRPMTFTVPRTNLIASDEGFTVEVVSPTEMQGVERGTTWRIDMELLANGAVPLVVYQSTVVAIQ